MPRKPTEDELRIINEYYARTKLTADDVRVLDIIGAKAGVQTAYFSYLTPKSISNFVMDVNGKMRNSKASTVGYYLNHDTYSRLPMGALFDAKEEGEEKDLEFVHKVFLPLNYSTGDVTSDDYLRSVELGISEQVSVGFISKKMICRLCNQDIRTSKCPHWPGLRYNVGTEEEPKFEICTYSVDEARLIEESAAWKGALPGARILSAGNGATGKREARTMGIKDFPEGSYLKFNCSGDGSIELANDLDVDRLSENGGILMDVENPDTSVEESEKQNLSDSADKSAASEAESNEVAARCSRLTERNQVLEETVTGLTAEVESLNQQLTEVRQAHNTQKSIADSYLEEIRAEIHKLSVGIDASAYSKENLDTLLNKFTLDEIKAHRVELRKKLSTVVAVGRSTKDEGEESSPRMESYIDKSCFKIGR